MLDLFFFQITARSSLRIQTPHIAKGKVLFDSVNSKRTHPADKFVIFFWKLKSRRGYTNLVTYG